MSKFLLVLVFFSATLSYAQELRIYAEDAPPNAFYRDGLLDGRAVEVVRALFKEIGSQELSIELVPWARGYALLSMDENTALFPVARTAERENKFKWAGQIMPNSIYLYRLKTRKNISLNSLDDLKNFRLGLTRADVKDQLLSKYTDNKEYVPEDRLNFLKAINGRIDIFPYASARFDYEVTNAGYDPELFERAYMLSSISTPQFLAFSKQTDDHIVQQFKDGFARLEKKGIIEKILDKWNFQSKRISQKISF
jgi:polar amino acid transport system substrate-binding protein